jgi:hypothetical protein
MNEIPTFQTLVRFDRLVRDLGLKLGDAFPLKREAELIRAYYDERARFGPKNIAVKWEPRFLEFARARISLERIVAAMETLKELPGLKRIVKEVVSGSIDQDFERSPAKDKLYELELAATLKLGGFNVELREPDIVASGAGLSRPLAIACKYPSSRQQIHEHISKGYSQITGQKMDGAVALGLDLIFGKEAGLLGWLDFRRSKQAPESVLEKRLFAEIKHLEEERKRDYPAERPLDGLIVTLTMIGIGGNPPALNALNSIALGCLPNNSLKADLEIVVKGIEAIRP